MNDVTDISAWRIAKDLKERMDEIIDEEEAQGILDLMVEQGDAYALRQGLPILVANDRTEQGFMELREELDREGRDYVVVGEPPISEFDL
jgi:hypothetical protein|tara:strand:- start:950 stop:1219 length:270 start_codon:yes stop_codon:yes gene_type:complete